MKDLIKLGEFTYVLKGVSNIGIYLMDTYNVVLIDTGLESDYSKIIEVLNKNKWNLSYIINTHSHADHTGNNSKLLKEYDLTIYASYKEIVYLNNPELMPTMLYGGKYIDILNNNLFVSKPSNNVKDIKYMNISGLKYINLSGHTLGSIGVLTSDNVLFCGDSYTSIDILNKQSIQFTADIESSLLTLNTLKKYNFSYYVPSHGNIESNIEDTINKNIECINNNIKLILSYIDNISYDLLLKNIFDYYHINMDTIKYYLIGFTIKSYLTFLYNNNLIKYEYINNYFKIVKVS